MSTFKVCSDEVYEFQNTGETYEGGTGKYIIGSRQSVNVPSDLTFTANNRPNITAQYESGSLTPGGNNAFISAQGVILDANGGEVVRFYPDIRAAEAFSTDPNVTVFAPVVGDTLAAGSYEILVFEIVPQAGAASGFGQICLEGEVQATPTPTPTFNPTATPTSTPAPTPTPTPHPTPTPVPTVIPENPVPRPIVPLGPQYTLTYSEKAKGWPSFYSYNPDYMVGMNSFFYTFNGGNLYRHNTNQLRNNFYGRQYNSTVTSVINELPIVTKLFKTINLQSDEPWTVTLNTDIQGGGFISNEWFQLKEGSWYADIKNTTQSPTLISNFASRAINGIGRSSAFSGLASARQFDFLSSPTINIGSILSVGDFLYFNDEFTNTPELAGKVTQINIDLKSNINNIVVDASINGAKDPTVGDPYVIGVKNNTAESYGLLGHFCRFQIENKGPSPTELFAVQAEIMKSYP
tara:strand:+ start:15922 stop:17310 length:1389 start_codon:yes stop_codon:yes gene_type:complete